MEHTNLDQNFTCKPNDWDTTDLPWSKIALSSKKDANCPHTKESLLGTRILAHYHSFMAICTWCIDIVEPFEKAMTWEYKYTLDATGYCSKWVESIPVRDFMMLTISVYIGVHIINRFSIPKTITLDNG